MSPTDASCPFCAIGFREAAAHIVVHTPEVIAFLDRRPVFPGHVLVAPRDHYESLAQLPAGLVEPVFSVARRVAISMETALDADGAFVGLNNRVSQSVPHLHVHVVPRRFKDGLRGFFWPRQRYESEEAAAQIAKAIREALTAVP
jgi:histidine triad (HIT) family protein